MFKKEYLRDEMKISSEPMIESRILDLEHLLSAIKISIQQGGGFLVRRRAPNGPIMRERSLEYIHKACWGLYAAGVDHKIIAQILDWVAKNALKPNGDFYFDEENPNYKILQRVYRPLTFLKVAAWIGHPLAENKLVINRMLQYQHSSGGVFHYIGEDPDKIEEQPYVGSLNTSFFGHLMIALDMKEPAVKAGDWILNFVKSNEDYMRKKGFMYTQMTPEGVLVTDVKPGEKITKILNNKDPKQEFWHVGTCMAYLALLYETMRHKWGHSEAAAKPYLDAAIELLEFEKTMPLYTYLWPSKCKVGWGAGELLRVLIKNGKGTKEQIEEAYRIARLVAIFTFMDNQLPNGGWSCMHYPLDERIPEMRFDYKPLKGMVNVPQKPIPNSKTIFLPSEEITGEFLGEMKAIETGIEAYLNHLRESL
ncbi:hypothetical protein CW704_01895 [Candidatus Bathyarchaeota archaeon]|nr:MAG: hypothetical protein CW704_01895 [Candidatus Bathyarchaeota archaeon]